MADGWLQNYPCGRDSPAPFNLHLGSANLDGFVKKPISALRFISLSLRRTAVRLAPRDSRALTLAFLRSRRSGSLFMNP